MIGLPMKAGGESFNGAEVIVDWGHPLARQTVAGGASAELSCGLVAVEAIGAVVDTPRRRQG